MKRIVKRNITRLYVFNYLKRIMTVEGRVPVGSEIAAALDISERVVYHHMFALKHADGLPMPMPSASDRNKDPDIARNRNMAGHITAFKVGYDVDTNAIPLDVLIGGGV